MMEDATVEPKTCELNSECCDSLDHHDLTPSCPCYQSPPDSPIISVTPKFLEHDDSPYIPYFDLRLHRDGSSQRDHMFGNILISAIPRDVDTGALVSPRAILDRVTMRSNEATQTMAAPTINHTTLGTARYSATEILQAVMDNHPTERILRTSSHDLESFLWSILWTIYQKAYNDQVQTHDGRLILDSNEKTLRDAIPLHLEYKELCRADTVRGILSSRKLWMRKVDYNIVRIFECVPTPLEEVLYGICIALRRKQGLPPLRIGLAKLARRSIATRDPPPVLLDYTYSGFLAYLRGFEGEQEVGA